MTDTSERWAAVGAFVRQAMAEAGGLTQKQLADRSGVSRETIRPVAAGQPGNYRSSTLAAICVALDKPSDSIDRILQGGEPDDPMSRFEERLGRIEARQDEIATAVAELLARLPAK